MVYIRFHQLLFEFDSIRFLYDNDTVELTRGVYFMCGCIYGLVSLTRSCTIANTIIHGHGTRVSFLKVLKIIHSFHGYTRMARV